MNGEHTCGELDECAECDSNEAAEAAYDRAFKAGEICSRCDCSKNPKDAYCGGSRCITEDLA